MTSVLFITSSPITSSGSHAVRNRGVIKGLCLLGLHVDVLSASSETPTDGFESLRDCENFSFLGKNASYEGAVNSLSGGGLRGHILDVARRAYHSLALYNHTKSVAETAELSRLPRTRYDYVISSSDPKSAHLAAIKLFSQGLKCAHYYQIWGDPWVSDISVKCKLPKSVIKREERRLMSTAEKIFYVSPFTLTDQKRLFTEYANRMDSIPVPYEEVREAVIGKPLKEGHVSIGYFGAYNSYMRNIHPLYEACNEIERAHLFLIGNSDLHLDSTENVTVIPRLEPSELEKYNDGVDFYVCVMNLKGTQIPGKLFHLAGTYKPVVVAMEPGQGAALREYIEGFGRFVVCENTKDSIEEAVLKVIDSERVYSPCDFLSPKSIASQIIKDDIG